MEYLYKFVYYKNGESKSKYQFIGVTGIKNALVITNHCEPLSRLRSQIKDNSLLNTNKQKCPPNQYEIKGKFLNWL